MRTSLATITQLPGTVSLRRAATGVLLATPPVTPAATTLTVYGLVAGRVGTAPLARYRLPEPRRGDTIVTEGEDDPEGVLTLPLIAEMVDRIAPWVQVHIVPCVLTHRDPGDSFGSGADSYDVDGRRFSPCGGLACYSENLVLVRLSTPRTMVRVLAHEIMHVVWHGGYLNAQAMTIIRAAIAARPALPGTYAGCESEAVAALFEGYAFSRFFGLPYAVEDAPGMTVHSILDHIWNGELARWLIARDAVPGAAALRSRLNISAYVPPAPPPPAPIEVVGDAVCRVVGGLLEAVGRLVFGRILSLPASM